MCPGGSVTGVVNGGGGRNTLDYSKWTTSVTVDLRAQGSAGRGVAKAIGSGVANVQDVSGGSAADTLIGNAADNLLVGNGGNDYLNGQGGNNVLLGGAGDDRLIGGALNDLLVGGTGADYLDGGAGENILIGGSLTTSYYNEATGAVNTAAFDAIMAAWTGGGTAASRAATIRSSSFSFPLNSSTVFDDAKIDTLVGNLTAVNWFFAHTTGANQDVFKAKKSSDIVDTI
jgi:Ca2+-binding RTX toxin-like protein